MNGVFSFSVGRSDHLRVDELQLRTYLFLLFVTWQSAGHRVAPVFRLRGKDTDEMLLSFSLKSGIVVQG